MGAILWLVLLLQVRSSGLKSVKMYRMYLCTTRDLLSKINKPREQNKDQHLE